MWKTMGHRKKVSNIFSKDFPHLWMIFSFTRYILKTTIFLRSQMGAHHSTWFLAAMQLLGLGHRADPPTETFVMWTLLSNPMELTVKYGKITAINIDNLWVMVVLNRLNAIERGPHIAPSGELLPWLLNMAIEICTWFSHETCWFSIVMLVY